MREVKQEVCISKPKLQVFFKGDIQVQALHLAPTKKMTNIPYEYSSKVVEQKRREKSAGERRSRYPNLPEQSRRW